MDHEDASCAPTTLESLPDELLEFIAVLLPHPDEDRLRNLEFSFVIVDLWNPGCLSQLTALAFSLFPCPILVKASAFDWTPPPPHDLQRLPISHLELFGDVDGRYSSKEAHTLQSLCAGLRTVCAFITDSRTSSHPLLSLTVPHIYQAIDAPVQLRDAANAVATLCRTEGVALRFVTRHLRFGIGEPQITHDFVRWWARVQAERAG
ncbi:hypothetical protein JCM3770_004763 [Rhodotorula araucariae]